MNNEIKEILDNLKDKCKYIEDYGYQYKRLSLEDTEILLDYITNLQAIEREYSAILSENAELQQENERLKVNCNLGYEELKVARNYKSRCEKTIEYINNFKKYFLDRQPFVDTRHIDLEYLLNILQNGSDSQ